MVRHDLEAELAPVGAQIRERGHRLVARGEEHQPQIRLQRPVAVVQGLEQDVEAVLALGQLRQELHHRPVGHVGRPLPLGGELHPGRLGIGKVQVQGHQQVVAHAAGPGQGVAEKARREPEAEPVREALHRQGLHPTAAEAQPARVDLQRAVEVQQLLADEPVRVALGDDPIAPAGALAPVEQGAQQTHVAVGGERRGLQARGGQDLLGADPQLRGVVELRLGGHGGMQRQLHGDQYLQVAHPQLAARTQRRLAASAQKLRALGRGLAEQGVRVLDAQPAHARERLLDVRGGPEHHLQQGVLGPVLVEQHRETVGLALGAGRQRLAEEAEGEAGVIEQEQPVGRGIGQGRKQRARARAAELPERRHGFSGGALKRITGGWRRTK